MSEKIISTRTYFIVCATMLVLTMLTVGASLIPLGLLQTPIALGIAAAKAALILLYSTHLRYSQGLTRVALLAGVPWFGILLAGTLDDALTRGWLGIPDH